MIQLIFLDPKLLDWQRIVSEPLWNFPHLAKVLQKQDLLKSKSTMLWFPFNIKQRLVPEMNEQGKSRPVISFDGLFCFTFPNIFLKGLAPWLIPAKKTTQIKLATQNFAIDDIKTFSESKIEFTLLNLN